MGIGFSFQTSPVRLEEAFSILDEISKEKDYGFYDNGSTAQVTLCRTGNIFFYHEDGAINGDCQTNIAGPGFHTAAIELVDEFEKRSGLTVAVDDETDYHGHRDFERMKTEHFYGWLGNLIDVIAEKSQDDDFDNICICWDTGQYTPEDVRNTIVTPMGRFSVSYLSEQSKDIAAFSKEFYLWNEKEIDARFFRNTALSMLWEDCYFKSGTRSDEDFQINGEIIRLVEKSIQTDPALSVPIDEYLELCALNNVEPLPTNDLHEFRSEFPIGYRRGMIQQRLGNLIIPLPGFYLYSNETGRDHVWYDNADSGWRTLRITAFGGDEQVTEFDDIFGEAAEPPEIFEVKDGKCKAAFMGTVEENDEIYYQIIAEVLSGMQITLMTVYFGDPEDKEIIMGYLKDIRANADEN